MTNLFDKFASSWWVSNGEYKILHEINPLRVSFIIDNIKKNESISKLNQNSLALKLQENNSVSESDLNKINILDVGCGGGILSFALAQYGFNITGIDETKNSIIAAKNQLAKINKKFANNKNKNNKHEQKSKKFIIDRMDVENENDVVGEYDAVDEYDVVGEYDAVDETKVPDEVNADMANADDEIDVVYNNINKADDNVDKVNDARYINFICTSSDKYYQICKKNNKQFDYICALEIIEHVKNPQEFLRQLLEILKPDGHLFISTINRNLKSLLFAKIAAEYLLRWVPIGLHEFNKFMQPIEISKIVEKYNAKIINSNGISFNIKNYLGSVFKINCRKNFFSKNKNYDNLNNLNKIKNYEKNNEFFNKNTENIFKSQYNNTKPIWSLSKDLSINYILCIKKN